MAFGAGARGLDGLEHVLERDDRRRGRVAAHAEPGLEQRVRLDALRLGHRLERQSGAGARRVAELEARVVFERERRLRALLRVQIGQEGGGRVGHRACRGARRAVERDRREKKTDEHGDGETGGASHAFLLIGGHYHRLPGVAIISSGSSACRIAGFGLTAAGRPQTVCQTCP